MMGIPWDPWELHGNWNCEAKLMELEMEIKSPGLGNGRAWEFGFF